MQRGSEEVHKRWDAEFMPFKDWEDFFRSPFQVLIEDEAKAEALIEENSRLKARLKESHKEGQ